MKRIATIFIMMCVLGVASVSTEIQAQNIDANRMNRDVSIMENILSELFRTQYDMATAETMIIDAGAFRMRGIRGTYLKDYGIIFMIPTNDPMRPQMRTNGQGGYSFYYNSDENPTNRNVDEESIVTRVTEFLMNYASTIGQLKDTDNVMVIYGASSGVRNMNISVTLNGRDVSKQTKSASPVISVKASMKDLKAYRTSDIDAEKMKARIEVATSTEKEFTDLKVMSNIFETALNQSGDNAFKMAGGVSYMMLDNFGAIFSFDARFSSGRDGFFGGFGDPEIRLRMLQDDRQRRNGQQGTLSEEDLQAIQDEQAKLQENMKEAYVVMKTSIPEFLVDYGRTLMSVDGDQHILTSVNIGGVGTGEIPERIDFQIKKSVLEDLDRGKISRENAIEKVVVTEF